MLKALELAGFKSFADRTRFEFGPGITVVVGPNGSGKSNIVDAVKWVLGEQSVKSLRGKEMADVIFNGSASRRGLGSAEVTLTLDNSTGFLNFPAPEVRLTRRVYRSGEGEYLINGQPCRRKDIRDLLAGTGIGTNTYSIIEQGKVDHLLQASPQQRRLVFEEAAGISRFRTKKIESQRRLERIEQNLVRLKDIVDEVGTRLRTVRQQAGKAEKYRQYTQRLQQLRTEVALSDWRRLSRQLLALEEKQRQSRQELAQLEQQREQLEHRQHLLAQQLQQAEDAYQQTRSELAQVEQEIASLQGSVGSQRMLLQELQRQWEQRARELLALCRRWFALGQEERQLRLRLEEARRQFEAARPQVEQAQQHLRRLQQQRQRLAEENEQLRRDYLELLQQVSERTTALQHVQHQQEQLRQQLAQNQSRREALQQRRRRLEQQRNTLQAELEKLQQQQTQQQQQLAQAEEELERLDRQHRELCQRIARAEAEQVALDQQIQLLQQWHQRREEISPLARWILRQAQQGVPPWNQVRGLVADLLSVPVASARVVEAVLGPRTGHLVAPCTPELREALGRLDPQPGGRVGLVWLDRLPDPPELKLESEPGILTRADYLVEEPEPLRGLAAGLLGRCWVVRTWEDAWRWHHLAREKWPQWPLAFVTPDAQLILPSGDVIVGRSQAATAPLVRQGTLQQQESQLQRLQAQLAEWNAQLEELSDRIHRRQQQLQQLKAAAHRTHQQLLQRRHEQERIGQELRQTADEDEDLRRRSALAVEQLEQAQVQLQQLSGELSRLESQAGQRQRELDSLEQERFGLEQQWQEAAQLVTEANIQLAKHEERLHAARQQLQATGNDVRRAAAQVAQVQHQQAELVQRADELQRAALQSTALVNSRYLDRERLLRQLARCRDQWQQVQAEAEQMQRQGEQWQQQHQRLQNQLHAQELAAKELRTQRESLAAHLQEEYGIELAELDRQSSGKLLARRSEAEEEIEQLRQKLQALGNVNQEALEELQSLEQRYQQLSGQYEDLARSRRSLQQIIARINADSRRLFLETLETVRGHFQELFRKLFGGGRAELVLEEGIDVLESGVDIVAQPPGKELRNLSLLSGGEKTLTCVALLLALFRTHPSPFCVLDEVDAALDEANIERFVGVLREFLSMTHFIIVTHSKKTMTAANTLYGVTMEESGVSKRVAVRFEDVGEDGEILRPEPKSEPAAGEDEETQAA